MASEEAQNPPANMRRNDRSDKVQVKREPDSGHGRDHMSRGGGGGRPTMDYRNRDMRRPPPQKPDIVKERLASMGPTTNLPSREPGTEPKKFTGRCRLFVGNLPNTITDDEFKKMFEPFGAIAEVFLNKMKGFGFVKLDTRPNAEAAKAALDFTLRDGKYLRVRFATHGAALKVKNLTPWVSNELLEAAFSIFGEVERAIVIVDDRGRPIGEGIIEYSRKQAAQIALKRCNEGCFLLTSSPRPVLVEPLEQRDEEDGFPEKNFQKNNQMFLKEREIGPRLAEPGSFEFEFATRWKKLYEVEKQKREHLEKEIVDARNRLDEQMDYALYEHETNILREKLRHMEEQSSMFQREREMRREDERRREEQRRQEEMMLRQQEEDILRRPRMVDDMRRRQEDSLMMQQEAALRQMQGSGLGSQGMAGADMGGPGGPMSGYDMGPGGPGGQGGPGMGGPAGMQQGPGSGSAPRQSRFDQPPPSHHMSGGMGGPPNSNSMNHGNMGSGSGSMGPPGGGSMGSMRGGGGPGGSSSRDMRGAPRDMMDQRDEYALEAKRRRY